MSSIASKSEAFPEPLAPKMRFTVPNSKSRRTGNFRNVFRCSERINGAGSTCALRPGCFRLAAGREDDDSITASLFGRSSLLRIAVSSPASTRRSTHRDRIFVRGYASVGPTTEGASTEEELDSVLAPSVVGPTEAYPRTNILSLWVERLVEAGLDTAILSSDDLPKRLAVIESSSSRPAAKRKQPGRSAQVEPAPFIRSLHLKTFRKFPVRRDFGFGTVNLIFGANGSGKASLLEAIELIYCGRNQRNPEPPGNYELIATYANGKDEKATAGRDLQLFSDWNLNWYGHAEIKTTNLDQSLAQFNFL